MFANFLLKIMLVLELYLLKKHFPPRKRLMEQGPTLGKGQLLLGFQSCKTWNVLKIEG